VRGSDIAESLGNSPHPNPLPKGEGSTVGPQRTGLAR
jgi:hypothetical protein